MSSKKKNRATGDNRSVTAIPGIIEKPIQDMTTEQTQDDSGAPPESQQPETQTDATVTSTPVVEQTSAPIVTETKTEEKVSDIDTYFNSIRTGTSTELKSILGQLEVYGEKMKPGRPMATVEDGAKNQYALWKTIEGASKLPMDQFRKAWNIILAFANTNPCFNDRYIFRFAEYWIWNTDELDAFQRILNLIKLTADPEKRVNGLKQVSLDRTLEKVFTQEAKQNIIAFYH